MFLHWFQLGKVMLLILTFLTKLNSSAVASPSMVLFDKSSSLMLKHSLCLRNSKIFLNSLKFFRFRFSWLNLHEEMRPESTSHNCLIPSFAYQGTCQTAGQREVLEYCQDDFSRKIFKHFLSCSLFRSLHSFLTLKLNRKITKFPCFDLLLIINQDFIADVLS